MMITTGQLGTRIEEALVHDHQHTLRSEASRAHRGASLARRRRLRHRAEQAVARYQRVLAQTT